MAYYDKFVTADELIVSMKSILDNVDPQTQARFTGFLSVSAVTVYELAIKEIIIDYANSKHCDFGYFVVNHLARLNGRIKIVDLKNEICNYGNSYKSNFESELLKMEADILKSTQMDLRSSYNNLILGRHQYVHAGVTTLSLSECIADYRIGKNVIRALHNTMK